MFSSAITDAIAILLFLVCSFVAARAFYLFIRVRSPRLFILGLSMGTIALTGAADYASSHITSVSLSTDWFLYIGQAVSYLFILLSLVNSSHEYGKRLMSWHLVLAIVALSLLFLSPFIPDIPTLALRVPLSSARCLLCFAIFFAYTAVFMTKQSLFSFLMGLAFLLLSIGYLVIIQKYFVSTSDYFDNIGDLIRMGGLIALLVAVIRG
jgi:hypothetical protein